jgi:hypothetical protein
VAPVPHQSGVKFRRLPTNVSRLADKPPVLLQFRHLKTGTPLAQAFPVIIRFTSTLTPEDENAIAPVVLKLMASVLDLLPIAYMVRIDTTDAHVYQHGASHGHLLPADDPIRSRSAAMALYDS